MDREIWIAVCAHRLQRQWRTIDPDQLDELAADLWRDERLRSLPPDEAATQWLEPLASALEHPGRTNCDEGQGSATASPS
jgi:hypothetical protein